MEGDADESGKTRLQHALTTLAQDPLFKAVLDTAQEECDQYFTATGRLRRTQGSKLVDAAAAVKQTQQELLALQREVESSLGIEDQVQQLRGLREQAGSALSQAELALATARAGVANARARAGVEQQLTAARDALREIDAQAGRVHALALAHDALAQTVSTRQREVAQAASAGCALLVMSHLRA